MRSEQSAAGQSRQLSALGAVEWALRDIGAAVVVEKD